ncbi:hypothetical protein GCM10011391_28340 [Pullulanibacillus camelliae]|uniref:Helix-turn-helix domain containing protein n=1 Tax=Pullulanibacillus camelliae TaxID=1707096 RepID=A0A8J3DYW2_9BACL|nr:helix-turn-helix domain-containing protein [Pullulanibacillus camelliae]GGE47896.1 hypothetical protein GCM10011391_28340 [Pullulanibacillus camelliae]
MNDLNIDNRAIKGIEKLHMKHERRNIHTCLEDYDFQWDEDQVKQFRMMWNNGTDIFKIARFFGRSLIEVVILIMDQAELGKIKQRENGLGFMHAIVYKD